tara:strand:- start:212 stop:409 length:198 start_codon:yes stop_codon:yes gene_type:complete
MQWFTRQLIYSFVTMILGKKDLVMSNKKQLQKLKNLNVKAEKCLTRDEAKKILIKASKAHRKINF